jgi:hypothetical protein
MKLFRGRIPKREEILYVFGGVVFVVYTWAIRGFLYQFSSLRLYHTLGEIFAVFSYLMAFALLESLFVVSGLVMIGFILPRKWFKEGFAYKGFITTMVAAVAMVILQYYLFSLHYAMPPMKILYQGLGVAVVLLIFLIWASQNIPKLQNFLLTVEERTQIFLYFYIPLGIVGLTVVILRNL